MQVFDYVHIVVDVLEFVAVPCGGAGREALLDAAVFESDGGHVLVCGKPELRDVERLRDGGRDTALP